jgi:hypothetical protein
MKALAALGMPEHRNNRKSLVPQREISEITLNTQAIAHAATAN